MGAFTTRYGRQLTLHKLSVALVRRLAHECIDHRQPDTKMQEDTPRLGYQSGLTSQSKCDRCHPRKRLYTQITSQHNIHSADRRLHLGRMAA